MSGNLDRRGRVLFTLSGMVLLLVLAVGIASCGSKPPTSYNAPEGADYSSMTWSDAFEALHKKISSEYAFTEWKSIDWKARHDKTAPAIKSAQERKDAAAYELALRDYVLTIPDGHVGLSGGDEKVLTATVGGSVGMNVMTLDDGKVVVSWVKEGGPAAAAGIRTGAEIGQWGGKRVSAAIKETPTLFEHSGKATAEGLLLAKQRWLVRGSAGSTRTLTFRNQGESQMRPATLTMVDDGGESTLHCYPESVIPPESNTDFTGTREQSMVSTKMLPGNIGYMRILAEIDLPAEWPGNHTPTLTQFTKGLEEFASKGAVGTILDIRNNNGGSDEMVAQMLGSLYDTKTFYEYQNYLDPETGQFEIWLANETPDGGAAYQEYGLGLWIEPVTPRYTRPVVAMINAGCISSGEGIAMGVRNLPDGKTTGFFGTNGSFGMAGDGAKMPGNMSVRFPFGQSLDEDKVVQIDSKDLKGGIAPESRVPLTLENVLKISAGTDVELEHAVKLIEQMQK